MHKKAIILVCLLIFIVCTSLPAFSSKSPVGFYKQKILNTGVNIVTVDLNNQNITVTPALAPKLNTTYPKAPFNKIVSYYKPVAAVTGTFFDGRTYQPVGSILINGKLVSEGYRGVAFCFSENNKVSLVFKHKELGRYIDWSPYASAISSGPVLVKGGMFALNPKREGFADPRLFRPAARTAMGITKNNKLLIVAVRQKISLSRLAAIMLKLKAHYAINLDGGESTALYYNGNFIVKPHRQLSNVIMVYKKSSVSKDSKFNHKTVLTPSRKRILASRYYKNGHSYLKAGRYEKALAEFKKAVVLMPNVARYQSSVAHVLQVKGRLPEASEYLNKASLLYLDSQRYDRAYNLATKSLQIKPNCKKTNLVFALACYHVKDFPAASKHFNFVLDRDPFNKTALQFLLKMGKNTEEKTIEE